MSETRTFLLELHCEEIPARFLKPLTFELAEKLENFCREQKLEKSELDHHCSPRKLSWTLTSLSTQQPDQSETQVGPPQKMCLDAAGQPTQTGLKFAEKWGVDFSAVRFEQPAGKKEPCAVVGVTKKGRPTIELLAEALPKLIAALHVPKAMRWGNSEFEFVRPIRNVLCLFGNEVVDFTVDGVRSSNTTWGHRLHHMQNPNAIVIKQPEDYEAALEKAGVVVSFEQRRRRMEMQLHELAQGVDGHVVMDEELLSTLAEIVEFPMIVRGGFPADFLDLPEEVLITSLKEHQKSFCIRNDQGLLPYFLAAANRPIEPGSEAEKLVAGGNEWVLKARLYDARFFFAEDRKTMLELRQDKLNSLTFQRDLGTYREKSIRIRDIADAVARKIDPGMIDDLREAAMVCKCDLRTLMVGEFPELQGIMGGEYLRLEGKTNIWLAVKEHYHPSSSDDGLPSTPMGSALALADKLDTLVGCFAVGIIPSGSKDPLALRRAGQGVVRILWEQGWSIDVMELASIAFRVVGPKATKSETDTMAALESFFRDRVAHQLEQAGYAGPVRRSALSIGWSDLVDLKARCEALSAFAEDPRFESLAQSTKRIGNILKDEALDQSFDTSVLQQAEEKSLAEHLAAMESAPDHASLLAFLAELAQPLEAFFTAVMVKCDDPALRAARLSLLHRLHLAFLRVADFSQWQ